MDQRSEVQLTLTIPEDYCTDFLGIMALDVLHDAKGRGYLAGHNLSELTDLLAKALILHNQEYTDIAAIEDLVFKHVLLYFAELWSCNLKALNLERPPDTSDLKTLRRVAKIPLRHVAGRLDEDGFISLGTHKQGIEVQNYLDQRDKLTPEVVETMAFVSPRGISKPNDYFRQAAGIVDIIRARTANQSKIVLDMKSAAGLIRTLTDPIGYTTGLPTYADPGYNMPGMSAIRQHAEVTFVSTEQEKTYSGPKQFRYCIQLMTPLSTEPLVLLDITYFYGLAKDGLDRQNMYVSILEEIFMGTLPRSVMMAGALNDYLNPTPTQISQTVQEAFSIVQHLIWDYYDSCCPQLKFLSSLKPVYDVLHGDNPISHGLLQKIVSSVQISNIDNVHKWCSVENTIFRTSYIASTLRNLYYFNVGDCSLLPEEMITTVLPNLMYDFLTDNPNLDLLAFCYHQLKLIEQYIAQENATERKRLEDLLANQWLPKRKGKLGTQVIRQVNEWRKVQANNLSTAEEYIIDYLQKLIVSSRENLGTLVELDNDSDDPRLDSILQKLPMFKPSAILEQTLVDHLHFYRPEMYMRAASINKTGLLVSTLLDTILWKKPLYTVPIDLQEKITAMVNIPREELSRDALQAVIGKFSGDFGQIMWCMCYGHIFASEDNNTSAMALFLQRLPKKWVNVNVSNRGPRWGSIHGLGDGSSVDVTLQR